jgi:hypothetical protein
MSLSVEASNAIVATVQFYATLCAELEASLRKARVEIELLEAAAVKHAQRLKEAETQCRVAEESAEKDRSHK